MPAEDDPPNTADMEDSGEAWQLVSKNGGVVAVVGEAVPTLDVDGPGHMEIRLTQPIPDARRKLTWSIGTDPRKQDMQALLWAAIGQRKNEDDICRATLCKHVIPLVALRK